MSDQSMSFNVASCFQDGFMRMFEPRAQGFMPFSILLGSKRGC